VYDSFANENHFGLCTSPRTDHLITQCLVATLRLEGGIDKLC